jgi:hypothetical protein
MNLNKIALCGVVAGSVAAMGCGNSTTPAGTDAGTDAAAMTMEPISVTYIVGEISIPSMPSGAMSNITPGFNLDDKVSVDGGAGNCEDFIQDFVNEQGETGVDNQLVGSLIGLLSGFVSDLDVQATVDEQISTGALLLAVRVNDIESFETDPDGVTLDLFLVDPAGCAMSPCAPMGGTVSADQMWAMQAGPALATGLSATIEGGVLSGGPLDLPLSFEASGMTIDLVIRDARVGGDISEDGMANGNIGGELRIDDIVALAEMIMPGIGETARGILTDSADLSPSSADPMTCESISAGIGFSAVSGTLE